MHGSNVAKTRSQELAETYEARYTSVQYAYVRFLSEHIADCSRVFEGDLQQMLILAIVGQAWLGARAAGHRATSASRLADVCGIPRETVRRKLKLMEEKGWVCQSGDQLWTLAVRNDQAHARRDLGGLDRRGLTRLSRLHAELERIAGEAVPDPSRSRSERRYPTSQIAPASRQI